MIYTPDGIHSFADAWGRHPEIDGFPVCHIDDIIAGNAATNRTKDWESLPRLESFRRHLRQN